MPSTVSAIWGPASRSPFGGNSQVLLGYGLDLEDGRSVRGDSGHGNSKVPRSQSSIWGYSTFADGQIRLVGSPCYRYPEAG
jgi:hypothetical protein